jgi:hypothetical protein
MVRAPKWGLWAPHKNGGQLGGFRPRSEVLDIACLGEKGKALGTLQLTSCTIAASRAAKLKPD